MIKKYKLKILNKIKKKQLRTFKNQKYKTHN